MYVFGVSEHDTHGGGNGGGEAAGGGDGPHPGANETRLPQSVDTRPLHTKLPVDA